MNPKPSKTYAQSMERLEAILEDIDRSDVPIDTLAERVVEAAGLLKTCKKILTDTEARVQDVLEELDREFQQGEAAEGKNDGEAEETGPG